jgi:large subunit ribosomal protein L20
MARVKGGVTALKRRRNILAMTKGYRFGRSTKKKQAKEAIFHAGKYSFAHRKDKKNDFRRLWAVRINAGLDTAGTTVEATGKPLSYSRLIDALKKANITVNRKMLALLAEKSPETFARVIKKVS